MKKKLIIQLTNLFVLQRKALVAGKSYSINRTQTLIAKKTLALKKIIASEIKEEENNADLAKEIIAMQQEWHKTKEFYKEIKNICNSFFYENNKTYASSGEIKKVQRKGSKIATA